MGSSKFQRPSTPLPESSADRLDSWKEIAAYLKRDERTVRRWEEEGLPVHRHMHKKQASIYAHKAEIDVWWNNGRQRLEPPERTRAGKPFRLWLLLGGIVAAGVLALVGFTAIGLRQRLLGRSDAATIRSLAVLPLENLSRDPEQEYFADGMTDELITDLAKVGSLRVISRTSSMRYKSSHKPLAEIAREMNVDAVVEGSITRSSNRIRITAQLIDAHNDRHLWAENYDRDLGDAVILQNQIAAAIAKQVQAELTPEEEKRLTAPAQVNPEAYQLYLRGLHAWTKGPGEGASASRRYFQEAIEKDPKFAPAYAWLAAAHNLNSEYQLAKEPARKALELDDSLSIAHSALAFAIYRGDWDFATAGREFQRALRLGPNEPMTLATYALYLFSLGRVDEDIEEMRRVLQVDPLSPLHNSNLAVAYIFAGREQEGILQAKTALDIAPDFSYAHVVVGLAYEHLGQYNQAAAEYRKVESTFGEGLVPLLMARLYAAEGRRDEALKLVRLLGSTKSNLINTSYALSETYAELGDNERAFALLEKAYQQHAEDMVDLKTDPSLKSLNSDGRFQDLVRRVGIPQ